MENIEFRCENCGNQIKKDILPGKHTILGTISMVNDRQECCGKPDYRDSRGYKQNMVDRSFRQLIPGIKA